MNHFGTLEGLYYSEVKDLREVENISDHDIKELCDKSFDDSERILEKCDMHNIRIMTIQDARYPDRLKNIDAPPCLLYYKGNMPVFDEEIAISIIGTRRPSAYGSLTAERIAFDIARGGGYVVSGMAAGLDAAAHFGALKAGRPTAAVLGGGVDVIYPKENTSLYEDIVTAGVVLSEYPPGTEPRADHFPQRNRIISGLSLGVLVIEAPARSGTLITANYASDQGRDLFAVPGPIDAPMSIGTNALIRDGYAKLTACAWDVLSEYAGLYPHKITNNPEPGFDMPKTPEKSVSAKAVSIEPVEILQLDTARITALTDDQRAIVEAVTAAPLYVDDIVDITAIPAHRVMSELTLMEIEGFVKELPGKRYTVGDNLYVRGNVT